MHFSTFFDTAWADHAADAREIVGLLAVVVPGLDDSGVGGREVGLSERGEE